MDLWLEEPSARTPGSDELHFQPLCKQSVLLMLKAYDPAAQTLRVRGAAAARPLTPGQALLAPTLLVCQSFGLSPACVLVVWLENLVLPHQSPTSPPQQTLRDAAPRRQVQAARPA